MSRHWFLILSFLLSSIGHTFGQDKNYPQNYFRAPMNIPLYLSGTFGELRTNHFHSGIDIKTQGREGVYIVAAADGYVSRIKISPYGFGKALYITHPNGYTSVYAHLQRFEESINQFVRKRQYLKKSFAIELFPSAEQFRVKKGDTIALSGNSGGSGGPHLHFEIRDTRTEKIINPLLFGFEIKDTRYPDLYGLEVYEFKKNELVADRSLSLLKSPAGKYSLSGDGIVEVQNRPAFGIVAFDRLNGANNKNGVYSIKMKIGGKVYYDYKMRTFAFAETRYINSHIDYGKKACCRKIVNKLYLEPSNRLSVYGLKERMSLPTLKKDSLYDVLIEVSDISGNVSKLRFKLRQKKSNLKAVEEPVLSSNLPIFSHSQTNLFRKPKLQVVLPYGALYRDIYFEYERKAPCARCLSEIHELAKREIPIHRYYTLKIKPTDFQQKKDKLGIVSLKNGKVDDWEGGKWENGFVSTRTRQFGEFAVAIDTTAPIIRSVNFKNGSSVKRLRELKIKIADNLSGIDTYKGTINGEWVLLEYDPKRRLLLAKKEEFKMRKGKQLLRIEVTDDRGNQSIQDFELFF